MTSDRRGRGTNKTLQKKPREQLREILYMGFCPALFVLLKIGVTHFKGVPRCVTKCGRGRESKLVNNSVTYFVDGP